MDHVQSLVSVSQLAARYAQCIDNDELEEWPNFFADECLYTITSRENHQAGRDMGVIYCDSKGMLQDRILGLRKANIYERQHYRHVLSVPAQLEVFPDGSIKARTAFAVYRIMRDGKTSVFATGEYHDTFCRTEDRLLISERIVVCDSSLFDTLLAIPL
ncbi:MAG TPA: aromatic-ring-hydroxylating dioxygenase subunit beta [Burkholderiales bacterium]|jgi:3-phenylpropionate/cinnamic acid dioxygenase small subunit